MGYYWEHNKIYVIMTSVILLLWIILFGLIYIEVNIELAATDNDTCSNPIAIFFDKANRERCLRLAAEKKSAIVQRNRIANVQKMYSEVYNLVQKIRNDYKDTQEGLVNLVNDYQNTLEYNQKVMKELASQIFKKLVANTFTKNYSDQRGDMVAGYDKIRQFLATFSEEDDIPELPRDARKGKK